MNSIPKTKEKESATESDFIVNSTPEHQNLTQLGFIYKILSNPTLSVIEEFVKRTNANTRKNLTTCMSEFNDNHYWIMHISLWLDIGFRIYAIFIALRVVLRGFGLDILLREIVR